MSYSDLVENRDIPISGETNWMWVKSDQGAFVGPKDDWEKSHSSKYLKYLKKREVCITAGGNCGMYARLYSKLFDVTYVFEPDPLNFHCLVSNTQTDNVIKIQGGVGEKNGFSGMKRRTMSNVGMHQMDGKGYTPIFSIDSFEFPVCDLLQLDVEGYELFALKGAVKTITKTSPVIVTENNRCTEFLTSLGYKFVERSGHADHIYIKG